MKCSTELKQGRHNGRCLIGLVFITAGADYSLRFSLLCQGVRDDLWVDKARKAGGLNDERLGLGSRASEVFGVLIG